MQYPKSFIAVGKKMEAPRILLHEVPAADIGSGEGGEKTVVLIHFPAEGGPFDHQSIVAPWSGGRPVGRKARTREDGKAGTLNLEHLNFELRFGLPAAGCYLPAVPHSRLRYAPCPMPPSGFWLLPPSGLFAFRPSGFHLVSWMNDPHRPRGVVLSRLGRDGLSAAVSKISAVGIHRPDFPDD